MMMPPPSVCHQSAQVHATRIAGTTATPATTKMPWLQPLFRQQASWRLLSNAPETTVYGGGSAAANGQDQARRRVTLTTLRGKYRRGEPMTMVTAYDYSSAVHVDSAGMDLILVGDSASMVAHGHDNTLPISLDLILHHCRAVVRGAQRPLIVGDLPFGSYESSPVQAVESAVRIIKEGGVDAVKLEGGAPSRVSAAKAIVDAGIAVMGHVGLTPQAISALGGFRAQGKTIDSALKVVEAALALQEAGCFAVVLECVPAPVAAAATAALHIPTIGIGAGPLCSGQSPDHSKVTPKFCKQFANVGAIISEALTEYKHEVEGRAFPGPRYTPYKISAADAQGFAKLLQNIGLNRAADAVVAVADNERNIAAGGNKEAEINGTNGTLSTQLAV
ncbi:hypothetical protein PR202_gb20660 [Eleusine coracana subsp. coracana]|uniref:3-methyl-2-oxobutanoate hydroxymethyltransferase n=1 Tax=Eleusine coracana subsp. coracana TaxID=191504 RepID=A0AAV5FD50_ELECO|nr:hypothetical protein PR202_gb20660 [Eleusine coracana subsp. coracana]